MVAGINGASNSPANKKKTKDYDSSTGEMKTAWSPAPPKEKTLWDDMKKVKKTTRTRTGYKNYVIGGGTLTFEEWQKKNQ